MAESLRSMSAWREAIRSELIAEQNRRIVLDFNVQQFEQLLEAAIGSGAIVLPKARARKVREIAQWKRERRRP